MSADLLQDRIIGEFHYLFFQIRLTIMDGGQWPKKIITYPPTQAVADTLLFLNYQLTDRPVETGSCQSPNLPTYIRLNLLPLTPLPLSGTLWGLCRRLSAPLFLLMRFSCLSKMQLGAAPVLTTSLSVTVIVHVCLCVSACVCILMRLSAKHALSTVYTRESHTCQRAYE